MVLILAPLVSAFLYSFAAIALKRAASGGVGPWRVNFVANCITGFLFAPLWFLGGNPFSWTHFTHAVIVGVCFFVGQIFTFLALTRGDVSVATPILGTKVILVAGLTVLLIHQPIPAAWWWAAILSVVATALMAGGRPTQSDGLTFRHSLAYGFAAALMFAFTDVLCQRWAAAWGFGRFAPVMFLTLALLSFLLIPQFKAPLRELPRSVWAWLIPGSLLLAAQALGIAFTIMTYGEATLVNILYTSRGIWTVALVWLVGPWFGNAERSQGHSVMARRLVGAALILVAVKLAVR